MPLLPPPPSTTFAPIFGAKVPGVYIPAKPPQLPGANNIVPFELPPSAPTVTPYSPKPSGYIPGKYQDWPNPGNFSLPNNPFYPFVGPENYPPGSSIFNPPKEPNYSTPSVVMPSPLSPNGFPIGLWNLTFSNADIVISKTAYQAGPFGPMRVSSLLSLTSVSSYTLQAPTDSPFWPSNLTMRHLVDLYGNSSKLLFPYGVGGFSVSTQKRRDPVLNDQGSPSNNPPSAAAPTAPTAPPPTPSTPDKTPPPLPNPIPDGVPKITPFKSKPKPDTPPTPTPQPSPDKQPNPPAEPAEPEPDKEPQPPAEPEQPPSDPEAPPPEPEPIQPKPLQPTTPNSPSDPPADPAPVVPLPNPAPTPDKTPDPTPLPDPSPAPPPIIFPVQPVPSQPFPSQPTPKPNTPTTPAPVKPPFSPPQKLPNPSQPPQPVPTQTPPIQPQKPEVPTSPSFPLPFDPSVPFGLSVPLGGVDPDGISEDPYPEGGGIFKDPDDLPTDGMGIGLPPGNVPATPIPNFGVPSVPGAAPITPPIPLTPPPVASTPPPITVPFTPVPASPTGTPAPVATPPLVATPTTAPIVPVTPPGQIDPCKSSSIDPCTTQISDTLKTSAALTAANAAGIAALAAGLVPVPTPVKIFVKCENNAPVYGVQVVGIPANQVGYVPALFEKIANTEGKHCSESNAIATVPEWWQLRPEANRPQGILVFKEIRPDGTIGNDPYSITIPHCTLAAPPDSSPLVSYKKGSVQGILTLKDNSKLIVNCKDAEECNRVIAALSAVIDGSQLEGSSTKIGQRNGLDFKQIEVKAQRLDYYPNGVKTMKPAYMKSFF